MSARVRGLTGLSRPFSPIRIKTGPKVVLLRTCRPQPRTLMDIPARTSSDFGLEARTPADIGQEKIVSLRTSKRIVLNGIVCAALSPLRYGGGFLDGIG